MLKEIVIIIVIIVSILSLDLYTQKFTNDTVTEITSMFKELKQNILKMNNEKMDENITKLDNKWNEARDKLAYYIEHDELEKVDTSIVIMKSYIDVENFDDAVAILEEGKFILEHIKEKNSFNLQNVF